MGSKHEKIADMIAEDPWVERKKRLAGPHPLAERQFSMAKSNIPVFAAVLVFCIAFLYDSFTSDDQAWKEDIWLVLAFVLAAFISIVALLLGLFSRYGTKDGYVWYRFGKLIDKKIPYDQLEQVDYYSRGYTLKGAGQRTRIAVGMLDYSLALIRILEELQYRRFSIYGFEPEEPYWETQAQEFRDELFANVYVIHQDYYQERPEELEKLEALASPPGPKIDNPETDDPADPVDESREN